MASQQDTLALAATVVDQFSRPLADLTRQLKAFSSLEQSTHQRGKRTVDDHWKGYRELALQSRATADDLKKFLTPAVEGLGLASIASLASIKGMSAAMKTFGEQSKTLEYLRTETGMTVDQLRLLENAGTRVGISAGSWTSK